MKKKTKKILRILGVTLVVLLVLPYAIPTSFEAEIPCLPFENSAFFNTEDEVILHTQVYEVDNEPLGKVLMIHGLGASTYSYQNNAPVLADNGYYVVSVDLPAFGYSSKDKGINHSQIENAKRLWELLEHHNSKLNSDTPWTIVGHSMGGSTSLAMVNQQPENIQSLLLLSPAITQRSNDYSWAFRSPIGQWLKVLLRYVIIDEDRIESILESAYTDGPSKEDIQGYLAPLQTSTTPQALVDFVISSENVRIDELVVDDIPIHLLWGEKDSIVPPDQIPLIQEAYPIASTTMLVDGGHNAHEKDPAVNQIMLDILRNTP